MAAFAIIATVLNRFAVGTRDKVRCDRLVFLHSR
jgi:hypothetical protein